MVDRETRQSERICKDMRKKEKKSLLTLFIFSIIFTSSFVCAVYLMPSRTVTIARHPTSFISDALSNVILVAADFVENVASSSPTLANSSYYLTDFIGIRDGLLHAGASFLEVNLPRMKIRAYKEGALQKEVPILLKGDPQGWGGTAAGLYKIESGNEIGFSVVSEVYLPYSLKFYGKYYIHGEPYYPGGEKLASEVSGGCIRISDGDAEVLYNMTEIGMPVLVIDKESDKYEYPSEAISKPAKVSAQSYLVADLDSGFVFTEKDSRKPLPIASVTKLMTAIIVAENVDLRKSILVTEEMLEPYGTTEGLEEEKRFGVVELFYPLLIESSNDAGEVLSYFLGKEKTIQLMQEKAKAILMQQTTFSDPSGFDPKNVSTAQDLFYLARYTLNNRPPLLEITRGKKVQSFGEVKFDVENFWNKNIFINDPSFVGGKTGFIKSSRNTAVFIFRFQGKDKAGRNIVIILLGSTDAKADSQRLYIWLQKNYFK